ncbi:MAG: tRNA (adenosine(37)-N6)-threonylcarbamoyltransferase complex ATPase subunit type 1 TsaE [Elusimicrobiota bacterium]|nr:tRNA (adenosine(37)-N6)-threonylcarbamoyltransferase complex ATPase subunit type 1 TsaE [Elusimicrobiota bacterium]
MSGRCLQEVASFESASADETMAIASGFAAKLNAGDVVLLTGELGVGKTEFARGIASFFGAGSDVSSPSYKIINRYGGDIPVYHMDFYRIKDSGEIFDMGIDELFAEKAIFVVEWPEIGIGFFNNFYLARIKNVPGDKREIGIFETVSDGSRPEE